MPPASENIQQGMSTRDVGRSSFPVPCWICTFLVMTALPVRAQEAVTIRYQPPVGRVLETRTEMHTISTLTGFPLIPDGSRLEEEVLIGATQRVTGTAPGGMVVEVAVDSVRGRMRPTGGAWHDLVHPLLEAGVARAVVSDQFKVVGIQSQGTTDGDLLQALGGFVIGLGFAFPSDPIAVGTTVATDGRVRTRVQTDSSTGLVLDQTMIGDLEITLDSVVHNPGDELSYFCATSRHRSVCRLSSLPHAGANWTRCWDWSWGPMTISPNPSTWMCSWPASRLYCDGLNGRLVR